MNILNTISLPTFSITSKKKTADGAYYSSFPTKKASLKDKIKTVRKAIKHANSKKMEENPVEYKSAWNNVFKLSNELRKEIEIVDDETMSEYYGYSELIDVDEINKDTDDM